MRPAARVADRCSHPTPAMMTPASPTMGSDDVKIGNRKAWRATVDSHMCLVPLAPPAPAPHGAERCFLGSMSVLINGNMAVRQGDVLMGIAPPNPISGGDTSVLIGDLPFGLADPANLAEWCAAFHDIMSRWDGLSPDERMQEVQTALNRQLAKSGTPPVDFARVDRGGIGDGFFQASQWKASFCKSLFEGSRDRARHLRNLAYHEGRHAEQAFAAARVTASKGTNFASQVGAASSRLGLDPRRLDVAEAAARRAARPDSSPATMLGKTYDQSVHGRFSSDREYVMNRYNESLNSNTLSQAEKDSRRVHYENLPEEIDAYIVGNMARDCC